jgi:copper(I)-binding protein
MASALDALAADGIDARGLFIAVDPERDTDGLSEYVRHFHPNITGATGTHEALLQAASTLGGAFRIGAGPNGATVDHSTSVFIVDSNARVAGYQLRPSNGPSLAADLRLWTADHGPDIVVRDSWVRPAIPGSRVTAGYGVLENHGPESVTVVSVDSPLATQVELHETFTEGTMAGMRATTLTIVGDGTAQLQPGGAHFMVFDITESVSDVPFELTLDNGTTAWIRMPVTEQ